MKNRHVLPLFVCGLIYLPCTLKAQVESGPGAGSRVEPLKVAVVTGDDAGKEIDLTARRKEKPALFVFVQADKWDRPMARFLRTLDQELGKDRKDVSVVAVWLTDDVDKAREYLPRAQESLKLSQTTFTVYPGDRNGPKGWGINADAHLTVVVAERGKVTASLGYGSVNETEVPAVLKKLGPKK
jgi:hypothetical protein